MKYRNLLMIAAMSAAALAAAGCGKSGDQVNVVQQESEPQTHKQAETTAPVKVQLESETESETQKLITSVEYTSKDGTIKITLPDNTWKVTQDADEMRVFSSGSEAMINIVHAGTESAMKTLSLYTSENDLKEALTKQYSDAAAFDIESFEEKTFDDVKTYRYVVKYNAPARMWACSVTYGIVSPEQAYVITGTITDDNPTLLKAVEDSVDSFTVLKDEKLRALTGAIGVKGGTPGIPGAVSSTTTSKDEQGALNTYQAVSTMYVNDTVNVRSGPGTDTDIVGGLAAGNAITVTGETTNWYQVSINGQTGYIRKDFVTTTQPETTAAPQQETGTVASAESNTAYNYDSAVPMFAADNANIRSSPSTDSNVSGSVSTGSQINVIGETANWYIVSTGNGTGYISKSLLSSSAPAAGTGGETYSQNGTSSTGGSSGTLSGTVLDVSGNVITLQADNGGTYSIDTSNADIVTTSGIYPGVYVSASYTPNQDGSLSATYVSG